MAWPSDYRGGHLAEVMVEGEMDDAVARGGSLAQDAQVVQIASQHLGAREVHAFRRGVGTGETQDLVTAGKEFGDDGRAIQPDAPVTNARMCRTSSISGDDT